MVVIKLLCFTGGFMAGTSNKLSSSNYHLWRKQRHRVLVRDAYTCAYCGNTEANTVDHVIARVNGGDDSLDNLVACCSRCNYAKGRRRGVFLGVAHTPPDSPSYPYTNTLTTVPAGPFEGQPKTEWTA